MYVLVMLKAGWRSERAEVTLNPAGSTSSLSDDVIHEEEVTVVHSPQPLHTNTQHAGKLEPLLLLSL